MVIQTSINMINLFQQYQISNIISKLYHEDLSHAQALPRLYHLCHVKIITGQYVNGTYMPINVDLPCKHLPHKLLPYSKTDNNGQTMPKNVYFAADANGIQLHSDNETQFWYNDRLNINIYAAIYYLSF